MPDLRLDRLATLYLFQPLQWLGMSASGVPILMYHSISGIDERDRHAYYRIATDPEVFGAHLRYLRDHRYTAIGLEEAVRVLSGTAARPTRPVVLTFDDGYDDFFITAFPILRRFGFSATVFLPTAYIGKTAREFESRRCLTWEQVRELRRGGVEFGSHTVSHPQLNRLRMQDVEQEIRCSKEQIEEKLGCAVKSFSYPYAFPETDRVFRERVRGVLEAAGYENGVSTILGTAGRASDRFFLERLPVNSADDREFFGAKLAGAYNWLHWAQYGYKRARV